jgi:hypothetical protein
MAGHMRAGAKQRAKRDGLPFSITSKDILELIGDGHCPVFGICYDVSSNKSTDASATLDKIIPSLGYVKGNCAVISRRANYIKSNATVSEIRRVADWMEKIGLSEAQPRQKRRRRPNVSGVIRKSNMTKANNPDASKKQDDTHFAPVEAGARGNKSADECASLRIGSLPKPSKVKTVDPEKNAGAAIAAARRQNTSDQKPYPKGRNVIENKGDNSLLTHDRGGEA